MVDVWILLKTPNVVSLEIISSPVALLWFNNDGGILRTNSTCKFQQYSPRSCNTVDISTKWKFESSYCFQNNCVEEKKKKTSITADVLSVVYMSESRPIPQNIT